jgi:hypothetical protein
MARDLGARAGRHFRWNPAAGRLNWGMFLVTSNKPKQLLYLSYLQRVRAEDLRRGIEDIKKMITDLKPGFRLLADFGRLESMDLACTAEIGRMMELLDQSGVGLLVRVFPDPSKDIGLDIMSLFHYRHRPQMATCKSMAEAFKKLSL